MYSIMITINNSNPWWVSIKCARWIKSDANLYPGNQQYRCHWCLNDLGYDAAVILNNAIAHNGSITQYGYDDLGFLRQQINPSSRQTLSHTE